MHTLHALQTDLKITLLKASFNRQKRSGVRNICEKQKTNLIKEIETELFILLNAVHFQPSIGSELHCLEDIFGKKFNTRIVDFKILLHHAASVTLSKSIYIHEQCRISTHPVR